jgi:mono/diheme cytochrome c family protein
VLRYAALSSLILSFAVQGLAAPQTKAEQLALGQKTYQSSCAVCHGKDGQVTDVGKSLGVANLRSAEVQKLPSARIRQQVVNGSAKMPPFGSTLTPEQIDAVVRYVRTLK